MDFFTDCISIKKALSNFGRERTELLFQYVSVTHNLSAKKTEQISSLVASLPVITLRDLKIRGDDVISIGITQGKNIKTALLSALNAVLTNECENQKEMLMLYLKTNFTNK